MSKSYRIELKMSPAQASDEAQVLQACAKKLRKKANTLSVVPRKRSIDARRGEPQVVLLLDIYEGSSPPGLPPILESVPNILRGEVVIVGAGPAGYFCALELLLRGIKPIVLERGKDTRARRYDLRSIMQENTVNPHSNYCFGEGGAGTYSDGKLYTRSGKRGDIDRVLQMLVEHGAKSEILVDAHPHIGSDKLPYIVENLRASIVRLGGEVHFNSHVTDFLLKGDDLRGVVVNTDTEVLGDAVILATGHSARDIYRRLHQLGIHLETKDYALGLRVEHPQVLVDKIQYRQEPRDEHLPAASYRLAKHGVYSFCMCPGGMIVPAATSPGEIVVNGMSPSKRNSRWANSGIVTPVVAEDVLPFVDAHGPLAGMAYQESIERAAFSANGEGTQQAPAQRLLDFLVDRESADLPRVSYAPGVVSVRLSRVLPERLNEALKIGFSAFGESVAGFLSEEAVLVGVESRTSSPVRIPRDKEGLHHPQISRLYPCAEGAGYAGGIVSAAIDGQRVARAVRIRTKS